jgi:hypothetical protein
MNEPRICPVQPDPLVWPLRAGDGTSNYQTLGKGKEKILWSPFTRPLAAKSRTYDSLIYFQNCTEKLISNCLGILLGENPGNQFTNTVTTKTTTSVTHECNQTCTDKLLSKKRLGTLLPMMLGNLLHNQPAKAIQRQAPGPCFFFPSEMQKVDQTGIVFKKQLSDPVHGARVKLRGARDRKDETIFYSTCIKLYSLTGIKSALKTFLFTVLPYLRTVT